MLGDFTQFWNSIQTDFFGEKICLQFGKARNLTSNHLFDPQG